MSRLSAMMKRHEVPGQQAAQAEPACQHDDSAPSGHRWSERAEIDPHQHYQHGDRVGAPARLGSREPACGPILVKAAALTPSRLRDLGVGSLVCAGLFLTEGIRLWQLKRWADW